MCWTISSGWKVAVAAGNADDALGSRLMPTPVVPSALVKIAGSMKLPSKWSYRPLPKPEYVPP